MTEPGTPTEQPAPDTAEVPTTSVVDVGGGVAIDLARVPTHDGPQGSHLRSTGSGYELEDGTVVARADLVVGPHPDRR